MDTRCPHCRGHWNDTDHLLGACPAQRVEGIPAGWTYLGLRGTRSGQAKPHYRTAPGMIRTRLTLKHRADER